MYSHFIPVCPFMLYSLFVTICNYLYILKPCYFDIFANEVTLLAHWYVARLAL